MPNNSTNSPAKFWLPLAFSIVLILGILLGIKLQTVIPFAPPESSSAIESQPGKIEELLRYIEAKYVDEIDREELVQKVIDNILEDLDPHSTYIPAEEVRRVNEQLDGNFEGIGIEFLVVDDTIVVINPTENGPSDKAGILAGDKIVAIGDSLIVGTKLNENRVVDSLRGKKGSSVKVGIIRDGNPEIQYFEIIRDEIPIYSVDASYMLNSTTGYIKINRFSSTTNKEFLDKLSELVNKQQLKNLVIDVRDNPGGYLQEATSILNQFFKEKDRLLVYTEGRNVHRSDYESTGKSFFSIDNIAVLIDEGSASASEILAGAIQDYDKGVIIGRRSFGKGLVQEQYSLKDGSAIRLTVARYYTPSGRSIQKKYGELSDYDGDIQARFESGELYNGRQIALPDTTAYYTKEGRIVHGGGGIVPDIFVPLDSTKVNPYFAQIQPFIRTFIYKFYKKSRTDELGSIFSYKSIDDFVKNFEISDQVYQNFLDTIDDEHLRLQTDKVQDVKRLTKLYLKARLAKHLFDENGLYAVLNDDDPVVKKAVQVMEIPNPLTVIE